MVSSFMYYLFLPEFYCRGLWDFFLHEKHSINVIYYFIINQDYSYNLILYCWIICVLIVHIDNSYVL